jgi:signal transduction histidine kinase
MPLTDGTTWAGVDDDADYSHAQAAECAELLHGLNNVLVSMLLSAQVMERKLPSYSRLKRNLHEIERSAQRGGELVRRLLTRLEVASREEKTGARICGDTSATAAVASAVLDEEPEAAAPPWSYCRLKH